MRKIKKQRFKKKTLSLSREKKTVRRGFSYAGRFFLFRGDGGGLNPSGIENEKAKLIILIIEKGGRGGVLPQMPGIYRHMRGWKRITFHQRAGPREGR